MPFTNVKFMVTGFFLNFNFSFLILERLILMFDDLFNNSLIYEYPAQFGAWCVLGAYVAQIFAPVRWNYSVDKHAKEVGLK